jgi:hypothetical protein
MLISWTYFPPEEGKYSKTKNGDAVSDMAGTDP